jgi:hypothetical protein
MWRIAKSMAEHGALQMQSDFSMLRSSLAPSMWPVEKTSVELASFNLGSVLKVCVIHDLNKISTLENTPFYVPNILAKGGRSAAKPYEVSDDSNAIKTVQRFVQTLSLNSGDPDTAKASPFVALLDPEFVTYRDGLVSIAVALRLSPDIAGFLSDVEKRAVIFHDGAYAGRTGLTGKESMLQIIIHAADLLSARFFC